jgi:uncharacterized protein (DUF952 family)
MSGQDSHPAVVYKVLRANEWAAFTASGQFAGSADDLRDGFIHLSTEAQLAGTLSRHFAGEADLVIVEFDVAALGAHLRWEASRGGALFPHLYGTLLLEGARLLTPDRRA